MVTHAIKTVIMWAGTVIREGVILTGFFIGFGTHDVAQILACAVSITCGFGLRMVMIAAGGGILGRGIVTLHAFATIFMAWTAYKFWEAGLSTIRPFSSVGLQVYLIICSFMAVYLIQSLEKISKISFNSMVKKYYTDDKNEGDKS